ncbi:MAG: DUF389 domain-containing protein [Marmoricola sp.]
MLHLRLRVPEHRVDQVLSLLGEDPTVTNVAVQRAAYVDPPGTMVQADVARESATGTVGRLRDLGLQHEGSISLLAIDTVLSDAADAAERAAPGAPDDGVVWESVENRLRGDSRFSWAFLAFIVLASLLAGAGRILDQPILIVGAMVVGPEFAAVAAICFALARPRWHLLLPATRTLLGGFALALLVCTPVWAVAYQLGAFTHDQASQGARTDFIVQPDAWSFAIAVIAGIAGTLALTTEKSGALVGVFISVTTIPAVGTAAVCLGAGVWGEVGSALTQLGLNILGMVLAGFATLLIQRLVWARVSRGRLP